jgi:hypothetical protein
MACLPVGGELPTEPAGAGEHRYLRPQICRFSEINTSILPQISLTRITSGVNLNGRN